MSYSVHSCIKDHKPPTRPSELKRNKVCVVHLSSVILIRNPDCSMYSMHFFVLVLKCFFSWLKILNQFIISPFPFIICMKQWKKLYQYCNESTNLLAFLCTHKLYPFMPYSNPAYFLFQRVKISKVCFKVLFKSQFDLLSFQVLFYFLSTKVFQLACMLMYKNPSI